MKRQLTTILGMGLLSLATLAAGADNGFLVTADRVDGALLASGRHVRPDQIEFLISIHSRRPDPALELISVRDWQLGLQKAEVGCVEPSDCLPFFVLIHDAALVTTSIPQKGKPPAPAGSRKDLMVHSGDFAILVLEQAESRITMPVICLQGGDAGQKIKVSSRDRTRFYNAEIVSPGLLRGSL